MKRAAKLLVIVLIVVSIAILKIRPNVGFVREVDVEKEVGEKWIGLISDTHISTRARNIPPKVFEVFKDVDLIIHAGDFVEIKVLNELEKIAPVIAVHGNMDFDEVVAKLPAMTSVEIDGRKIGVVHDAGIFGTEKMKVIAEENDFDILVFGHTHRQFLLEEEEGKMFINPGSPTNPLPPFLVKPSVAILRISGEKIEPIFVEISQDSL